MKNRSHTFVPYVDNGPYPYPPYHLPNERGEPPLPPLRGSFSPPNYDAGLPSTRPTRSWRRSAVLDTSDPAAAICLAARRGDVPLLASPGSLQENYCCSMGMGTPPTQWTAEIDAP